MHRAKPPNCEEYAIPRGRLVLDGLASGCLALILAALQVAVRCRPFSIDDKLGVQLVQNGDEEGEVNLLNSEYTTDRFAFTYSWWSAYGYDRHIKSNEVYLAR